MRNSILKFAAFFLTFIFTVPLFAQEGSISPYSRFGLGDLNPGDLVPNFSMGGTGIAITDPSFVNLSNPAATSFLAKPTFDVGIGTQFLKLKSSSLAEKRRNTFVNHFTYAFPVHRRWTITALLRPYSRVGYKQSETYMMADSSTYRITYRGSGGLNQATLGNAFRLYDHKDSTVLSVGLHVNYIFGTIDRQRKLYLPASSQYFNTRHTYGATVKDFSLDAGALFSFYPNKTKPLKMNLGMTYSLPVKLRADQELLTETFDVLIGGSEPNVDTVSYEQQTKGYIMLPAEIGLGASVIIRDKWIIGLDYAFQQWSKFTQSLDNEQILSNLGDANRFSFGVQYTPQQMLVSNLPVYRFFNYRLGFRSEHTYLSINGEQVKAYGISAGLGIPLKKSNSMSRINLGYELSGRGTTDSKLIRENYSTFMVGFSICPVISDRWFYRPKYD